jgi:superkiller protein 3
MTDSLTNWDQDVIAEPEEVYASLVRALRRTEGFGLFFVRCDEGERPRLIERVKTDLPDKAVQHLVLDKSVEDGNFYKVVAGFVAGLPDKDSPDILFISGIEKSLEPYIQPGYGGQGDYYKLDTVPRILGHFNLQRERFRDDFPFSFVFLVPLFALKYFMLRAPDFFDWRSGVFEFIPDADTLAQKSAQLLAQGDFEQYRTMTHAERLDKVRDIQSLIEEDHQDSETKARLWFKQGNILTADGDYTGAITSYERALEIKPDDHAAWYNRGIALSDLGHKEEAIASYERALEIKPDDHAAWYNRGYALDDLGRYEEAIASYERALEIKPDYHAAWYNRGYALDNLGRKEEAIASYERALEIKPDLHEAWYNRGNALSALGHNEEAIASYQKALQISREVGDQNVESASLKALENLSPVNLSSIKSSGN